MSTEGADDVVLDPSSVSEIIKQGANVAIPTLGFYYEHDATVGAKTSAMIKRRIDCQSKEGLDFYEANILNDSVGLILNTSLTELTISQRVQDILDSFFPPSSRIVMARYRNFAHDPNHIFQYRAGGEAGRGVLVVQLWAEKSRAVYYAESYKCSSDLTSASNGLFETGYGVLQKAGCKVTEVEFEHGGLYVKTPA